MRETTETIIVDAREEKEKYVDSVWEVLKEGYENVKGGLFFKSKLELLKSTKMWKVILFHGAVVAVTIYKVKNGLKIVALSVGQKFRDIAVAALARLIKHDLKSCWMELSEAAEKFVMKNGGKHYVVPNYLVENILGKEVSLADDGIHYIREVMGMRKKKILLGTVRMSERF